MNYSDYVPTYISTNTTTQIFTGKGVLHAIVVGTTAAGAITVADGTAVSSATFAVLKSSVAEGTYRFDCACATGLRITTAASSLITVIWAQG